MRINNRKIKLAVRESINELKAFDDKKFETVEKLKWVLEALNNIATYFKEDDGYFDLWLRLKYAGETELADALNDISRRAGSLATDIDDTISVLTRAKV